jgi:type IV pilus biogenesis protein CpaD/CtpE
MTKKRFFLGILVVALVFGMTVVGCDRDPIPGSVTVKNNTSFNISEVYVLTTNGTTVLSYQNGIAAGAEKKLEGFADKSNFTGRVAVVFTIPGEGSVSLSKEFTTLVSKEGTSGGSVTFYGDSTENLR